MAKKVMYLCDTFKGVLYKCVLSYLCQIWPANGIWPYILKQTTVGHALTMHDNSLHLSWLFIICTEPP